MPKTASVERVLSSVVSPELHSAVSEQGELFGYQCKKGALFLQGHLLISVFYRTLT